MNSYIQNEFVDYTTGSPNGDFGSINLDNKSAYWEFYPVDIVKILPDQKPYIEANKLLSVAKYVVIVGVYNIGLEQSSLIFPKEAKVHQIIGPGGNVPRKYGKDGWTTCNMTANEYFSEAESGNLF